MVHSHCMVLMFLLTVIRSVRWFSVGSPLQPLLSTLEFDSTHTHTHTFTRDAHSLSIVSFCIQCSNFETHFSLIIPPSKKDCQWNIKRNMCTTTTATTTTATTTVTTEQQRRPPQFLIVKHIHKCLLCAWDQLNIHQMQYTSRLNPTFVNSKTKWNGNYSTKKSPRN